MSFYLAVCVNAEEAMMIVDLRSKFTERMKTVLNLALEEMIVLNHHCLEPQHILLGILKEGNGVAGEILRENGIFLEDIYQVVTSRKANTYYTLSLESEHAIQAARGFSREFNHNYIGTEHMLLGLYSDPMVADILEKQGLSRERARKEIRRKISPKIS